jgi:hypothetical protein
MVKWKTGLNCRSLTAIIGKQVNLGLEISMNDTNYLISSQQLTSLHCADINLRHSLQTYFRATLNWRSSDIIIYMSDPNSKSSDILSDGPVKDILRPVI